MSFRGRDPVGNPNKMELGEPRKFGGPDNDKPSRDESDRFDSGRGRRPPFGRGRPSPGRDRPYSDRPRDFGGYGRDEPMSRDRSPLRGPDDRFSDRFRKDDGFSKREDHSRKDTGRPFYGDDLPRDRFMESRSRHDGGSGNFSSRFDGPSSMPYKARPLSVPDAPPSKGMYHEGFPKPNECEIIVVNKQQRDYAESVEARVKNLGILVDILFLKDEALLTQTIDDIARRGSLYAMVISPQNETHRSVTVNILHGTPQEHRNMPLEDALKLLSRNFHEHIRSQRENMERERAERGPYVGVVSADREIQFILRMLADGRWISLSEINLVIRYLSERRDKISGDDRGPGRMPIPPSSDIKMEAPYKPKDDQDVSQKEQDLQNRIINLMNQGAPTAAGGPSSVGLSQGLPDLDMPPPRQNPPNMSSNMGNMRPPPGIGSGMKSGRPGLDDNQPGPQGLDSNLQSKDSINKPVFSSPVSNAPLSDSSSTATYINFDNPSVQKALDNLMQSGPSLLKNISLSASGVTNTPSNPASASSVAGDSSGMSAPSDHLMQRGNMGPPRGPDVGGNPSRNLGPGGPNNMDINPRGAGNMSDVGGPGGPRNSSNIPGIGGMGSGRGGYGNMPDMGHMNNSRGFGGGSGMGPDMGRMGPPRGSMGPPQGQDHGPPQNMGLGGNFSNQNQYSKFPGPGQGNFPGSYNSGPGMGGMSRQGYGGPQGMGGMGGGTRRY